MKKTLLILSGVILFISFVCNVNIVCAQKTDKEIHKEMTSKVSKDVRKDAKRMKAEGWNVAPGSLPLEKLLQTAQEKQLMTDEKGQPKYITADGNGVAETKAAAEMQAIETAKLQLAGMIETLMNSLVSTNLGNEQINREDAASVTQVVQTSKNLISTQLGYINPLFKIYRDIPNTKNVEVQVKVFYETAQSLVIAKKVIKKELKEKMKMNDEQLDRITNFSK